MIPESPLAGAPVVDAVGTTPSTGACAPSPLRDATNDAAVPAASRHRRRREAEMLAPFAWDARAAEHPAGCALAVPDVTVKRARRPVERLSIEHPSRRARAASLRRERSGVALLRPHRRHRGPTLGRRGPRRGVRGRRRRPLPRASPANADPPARALCAIMRRRESGRRRRESDAADAEADVADVDADRRAPPPHLRRRRARAPHRRFVDVGGPSDDDDLLSDDTDGSDVVDDDASVHTHSDASLERARGPKAESLFRPSEDWNSEDDAANDAAYFARRAAEGRGISPRRRRGRGRGRGVPGDGFRD